MDERLPADKGPGFRASEGILKRNQELTVRVQELTAALRAATAEHRDVTPLLRESLLLRQERGSLLREQLDNTLAALPLHTGTPTGEKLIARIRQLTELIALNEKDQAQTAARLAERDKQARVYRYRDQDAPTAELRERYRSHLERFKHGILTESDPETQVRKMLVANRTLLKIMRDDFSASTSAGDVQRAAHLATEIKEFETLVRHNGERVREFDAQKRPQPTPKGLPLYVVQSGRSSVLHLMRSKNASTPNPASPGSIIAQLVWFGGNGKRTLCGKQATRSVGVFRPHEATCRECRRRGGFG